MANNNMFKAFKAKHIYIFRFNVTLTFLHFQVGLSTFKTCLSRLFSNSRNVSSAKIMVANFSHMVNDIINIEFLNFRY